MNDESKLKEILTKFYLEEKQLKIKEEGTSLTIRIEQNKSDKNLTWLSQKDLQKIGGKCLQEIKQKNRYTDLRIEYDTYYRGFFKLQDAIGSLAHLQAFLSSMWSLRWVAKPVGYLLPRDDREEWLGDLKEIHHQMLVEDEYPVWFINLIIATKTLLLVWSAIEVHIVNLLNRNSGA